MPRFRATATWLRRKREEADIASAAGLARAAHLSLSHVATLERGEVQPRPATVRRLSATLRLTAQERHELGHVIAGDRAPDNLPSLQRWAYFPAALLAVPHNQVRDFELAADDWLVGMVRGLGAVLACLVLLQRPPGRKQVRRLADAAARAFEQSRRSYEPRLAACDATFALRRAWYNEAFAHRHVTERLVRLLDHWAYFDLGDSGGLSADFADSGLDRRFSFQCADVSVLVLVHDAITACRLWAVLDLSARLGVPYNEIADATLANRFSAPKGDLATLFNTAADDIRQVTPIDLEREFRLAEFCRIARRVDVAMRLFEFPDLAVKALRMSEPGKPERPVQAAEIDAALTRAAELIGPLSVRFPGPTPRPVDAQRPAADQ